MKSFGALILLSAAAATGQESEHGLKVISGRPVIEGVYLNGRGPFRFLLDTGAETNQVEPAAARKAGLNPAFRSVIATTAGSTLVPGGSMDSVAVGPAKAFDQEFLVTGLDAIHGLSYGIQGVVGQEFLSRFDYLLDFAGRRIVFGAREPGGIRTAFSLVDGRPAIETDRGRMVIDSGTNVAVLYLEWTGRGRGQVVTASGAARVSETRELRFRVAGREYLTAAVTAARGALKEDGVLPASVFRSIYVKNSGKYLILNPDP